MPGATHDGAEEMLRGLFRAERFLGLGVSGSEVSGNGYERESIEASDLTFVSAEISTTLSVNPGIGDTTISLASVAGLNVGDRVHVGSGDDRERVRITAINGNVLTLASGLVNDHANLAEVVRFPQLRNTNQVDFGPATGAWGDVTEITIHTALTGGDELYEIVLTNDPDEISQTGTEVGIPAGGMAIVALLN